MIRPRLAIIGFGRLGRACVTALRDRHDLDLAGVVHHGEPPARPPMLEHAALAGHVRELKFVDAALICVPVEQTLDVARGILQQRIPVIECARLEGSALEAHYEELGLAAGHHHVAAIVGAGWDPGILPLVRRLFEVLIPRGHTEAGIHPGVTLRHSAVKSVPGVEDALVCERRTADRRIQHYIYVKLDKRARIADVERAITTDPLYAGDETFVFPVADPAALEAAGSGIVLQRYGTGSTSSHQSLLLEARFDVVTFAAHVMLDAVHMLRDLKSGAHRYRLGL